MAGMENFLVNNRPMAPKDWAVDVAVMLAAFLFGCGQLMLTASSIVIPDLELRQYLGIVNVVPDTSVFVALALTTLPLAARRRFPWPVFLFVLITFLGLQGAFRGFSLTVVGPVVALYTIACERGRTEAAVAVALAVAGVLFADAPSRTASLAFFTRFQNVALLAAAALAGYAYRTHRAYVAETERRALEAERSREEEAARRVEEERVRIAREVHDITAHSLSAVSIQAAAAERLVDRDPAAAKKAIATARTTAKDALEEIRGMIGVLRAGDPAAETEPTAGTERLDDLAAYLRRAGVDVALDAGGYDRAAVPAFVDVALYGIAREAATNIVRHAGARSATMRLFTGPSGACLTVEDDGRGAAAETDGHGHGIAAAVRVVAAGDALIQPSVMRRLVETFVRTRPAVGAGAAGGGGAGAFSALTEREREILVLVARGMTNDEIGAELFISPATVKTHLARVMAKLGAHDRAQLVVRAYEGGLVRPGARG
ncbi:two-component sensor histidine kinase [Gordonibacter pamelaeae]|uniref:histidine kinase n=3 Tax=Gordonibacter pamelaeae TaxID=471189 RepID=A0A369M194_9ACTN|nr:two-component sensor histidine kinase [Gordonibacter pamelaeae]